jgi:hypothetical protein
VAALRGLESKAAPRQTVQWSAPLIPSWLRLSWCVSMSLPRSSEDTKGKKGLFPFSTAVGLKSWHGTGQ